MLRANLSTRPFYNERGVHLALGLVALVVLAVTVLNAIKVVELSKHSTELSTRVGRDRSEAERLTREAARIRRGINQKELALIAAGAREANALIDQRTFSWTAFFNQIESTLPPDVMLSAVRPVIDDKGTHIGMQVLARNVEDIHEFMEKLEATGAFDHVLQRSEDQTQEGLNRFQIEALYVPDQEVPAGKAGEDESEADKKKEAPEKPKPGPAAKSTDAQDQGASGQPKALKGEAR
jgi:Tfp pilus assembly protein PilN